MESVGVALSRLNPFLPGVGGVEPQAHSASFSGSFCGAAVQKQGKLRDSAKSLKLSGISNFVFSDQSYLDYYSSGRKIRCGACKEKVKEEKLLKKRSKMLESLSMDLTVLFENGLVDPIKAKTIFEAADLLREQLQQLRSEEKELKQRRKDEKNRLKASQLQSSLQCDMPSSSSSESSDSDSDCGVVDTSLLDCNRRPEQIQDASQRISALPSQKVGTPDDLQESIPKVKSASLVAGAIDSGVVERGRSDGMGNSSRESAGFSGSKTPAAKKIEVCMGGKCKKSGAAMLMEEFQKVLGFEGAVSACKCLGKCRYGPNVRISNNSDEDKQDVVAHDNAKPASTYQLCLGVSSEDVDSVVDNYLGGSRQNFDLAAAF